MIRQAGENGWEGGPDGVAEILRVVAAGSDDVLCMPLPISRETLALLRRVAAGLLEGQFWPEAAGERVPGSSPRITVVPAWPKEGPGVDAFADLASRASLVPPLGSIYFYDGHGDGESHPWRQAESHAHDSESDD